MENEKVYIVLTVDDCSGETSIMGVFKTKESALKEIAEIYPDDEEYDGSTYYVAYDVKE